MIHSIQGRVRQTVQLVFAWGRPVEDVLACEYLSSAEYHLYLRMSRAARQHHLRVLKYLLAQGERHPALLKAALLHDVGKIRFPFTLPEKVLVVLVRAFAPKKFHQWAKGEAQGWRRPFVVSAQHPAWSAEMVAAVGSDSLTLDLIRRHQTHLNPDQQSETDQLLRLLQNADDRS